MPSTTGNIQSARILMVEDEVDLRRLNREVLMEAGYQVDAAEDGAVAWSALQLFDYDLLLTDNHMPKLTGVELIKKLRSEAMTLPVILVSGAMPTEEIRRQPWLKIQALLAKPYTIGELLKTVKEVLRWPDGIRAPAAVPHQCLGQPRATGLRLR